MEPDEQLTVTRTVILDASADEVWRLLTDDAELSRWFGSAASLDAVPGGVGTFVDGSIVRRAVVQRVDPGRRVGFTWWDERHPAEASTVELVVEDTSSDGRVQLTVTETVVPSGGAVGLRACSWIDVADAWDERLGIIADRLTMRSSPLAR
ncbi:MAG: SRPBCC domain-containing protein [Actinomycetota bacterium]|nr:SRPBCC domain-containing protein [Actinomycetota bacterium]